MVNVAYRDLLRNRRFLNFRNALRRISAWIRARNMLRRGLMVTVGPLQ
jgi:hypothetical protein